MKDKKKSAREILQRIIDFGFTAACAIISPLGIVTMLVIWTMTLFGVEFSFLQYLASTILGVFGVFTTIILIKFW